MARIYLVSPTLQANVQMPSVNESYSLGLAYLHAVIEQAGHEITTRNFNHVEQDSAERMIEDDLASLDPEYLLVQVFTMNRVACYRVIEAARRERPHLKIIVGGVHASIFPEQLLTHFAIDYVVIGEGERTVVELLEALEAGTSPETVNGIAFLRHGVTTRTAERGLIADLDSIPFPRHELFINPERTMACILTSRGCPFKCSFCCLHAISRRRYRTRSVANVIAEVEYILANFPNIQVIQLADDTFTLDQQRALEFCREVIRRGIRTNFICSARIKPASQELFTLMAQAGFTSIGFGLETGSERLMKSIHKSITRADVVNTFRMLKGVDINVSTYLMVGFPGETDETVGETISLIKELQRIKYFEFAGVARLWVYPDTEVYHRMKEAGLIDDNFWLGSEDVPFYTVEHPMEELDRMVVRISLSCMTKRQMLRRVLELFRDTRLMKEKLLKLGQVLLGHKGK